MMAYKFRLYPSKQQEQVLFKTFDLCRFAYNQLLEKLNKQENSENKLICIEALDIKEMISKKKNRFWK